jgi:hypothetical protein
MAKKVVKEESLDESIEKPNVEIEAWFISTIDRSDFPTGIDGVSPIDIVSGSPFSVRQAKSIIFFNDISTRHSWIRKLKLDEVEEYIPKKVSATNSDEFVKNHKIVVQDFDKLKTEYNLLSNKYNSSVSDSASKDKQIDELKKSLFEYKEKYEDLVTEKKSKKTNSKVIDKGEDE